MTLHYHGTPITPNSVLQKLAGRCFCVSFARPDQIKHCHEIGQSVLIDNGAFSRWRTGKPTNWPGYYNFCNRWLAYPTTWAVIPDCIDAGSEAQDDLLAQWPFGNRGAPVWHMDEPLDRLVRLTETYERVCIGSTAMYATLFSDPWQRRMDSAWDTIVLRHRRTPWIHMLRGMNCAKHRWPFASLDSTDIARNHNRTKIPKEMLDRWDSMQCPADWEYLYELRNE